MASVGSGATPQHLWQPALHCTLVHGSRAVQRSGCLNGPWNCLLISNAQVASDYISCTRTLCLASLQEYLFLLGGRCFSLCLSRKGRFASIWNARVWWNGFMQSFWNSVSVSAWLICQVLAQGRRSVTVGCEYCEGSEKDAVSVQLFGQWTEVNHKFSSTSRPSTDH